jgi:segregation and condensation protein B
MDQQLLFTELKYILEALLLAAPKPLSVPELRDILSKAGDEEGASEAARSFRKLDVKRIHAALEELAKDHADAGRSYRVACVAGTWQFVTLPEFAPWVRAFLGVKNRPVRLSLPALETLAVIAYRQPVTRTEVEQIRGVAVDGVIATLKERGLIDEAGRAVIVGRPMQYGTTPAFLEYFGLANLDGLPSADELRRIPVTRPETLPGSDAPQLPLTEAAPSAKASTNPTAEAAEPIPEPTTSEPTPIEPIASEPGAVVPEGA